MSAKVLKNGSALQHHSPSTYSDGGEVSIANLKLMQNRQRSILSDAKSHNLSTLKNKHHVSMYLKEANKIKSTVSLDRHNRFRTLEKKSHATRDMSYVDENMSYIQQPMDLKSINKSSVDYSDTIDQRSPPQISLNHEQVTGSILKNQKRRTGNNFRKGLKD